MESFRSGITVGNGAAINVELGWIPDRVEVYNATTGTPYNVGFPNLMVIPFSGGGTNEISVGDTITGQTNGATAIIKQVLLYSGTWAGGDAAGFFTAERDDIVGTFTSEAVVSSASSSSATDDADVTVQAIHGFTSTGAIAAANTSIIAYVGVAGSNAKGFTIASGLAVEAKVLRWAAYRDDR
ncbi:hypothetical protein LCGC14_2099980 [marine sediment metagenome]|uniref:Uncharacterized protein n=1 Tax=marine sediment metagenome TaxID=412755 RepID=A0A0F9H6P4_9ZZZZ